LYLIVGVVAAAQQNREVLRSAFKIKQTFCLAMEMTIKIASNLWHTEIERWRKRKWEMEKEEQDLVEVTLFSCIVLLLQLLFV